MEMIPETHLDLLEDEKKAFLYLSTLMHNGAPQVTPVWFNTDGTYILINTAEGRVKDRNMRARPDVTLCITDPTNPYRYLQIRGKVVEYTADGADDHIDMLAFKYQGVSKYPSRKPEEKRIIFKIKPIKVDAHG
jgi:PPOX class probable F420-dependent enzyme